MADLSSVDPVARVIGHLQSHTGVLLAFGGANHISGLMEAPWPHLRVTDGEGGDLRGMRWSGEFEVMLECYGDPGATIGEGEVRRLCLLAGFAVKELEDADHVPGTSPVSFVGPSGVAINQKLTNGQYRFTMGLTLVMRPVTT